MGHFSGPSAKPLTVTTETARRLIGIGNTTLYKLVKEGRLRTARVGSRTLVVYRDIERLLGIDDERLGDDNGGEEAR